jgi:hypothetical protein
MATVTGAPREPAPLTAEREMNHEYRESERGNWLHMPPNECRECLRSQLEQAQRERAEAEGLYVVLRAGALGVRAEREAALAREKALREALRTLENEELSVGENEEGEDHTTCNRCEAWTWGDGRDGGITHEPSCPFAALSTPPAGPEVKP